MSGPILQQDGRYQEEDAVDEGLQLSLINGRQETEIFGIMKTTLETAIFLSLIVFDSIKKVFLYIF